MFELPNLPYSYNALEPFIDEETIKIHHDGHHATYVKNLNEVLTEHEELLNMDIETLLESLDQVPAEMRIKVKNNAGGHYHHSIFWSILMPTGSKLSGKVLEAINQAFGNFATFQKEFNDSASRVFGSGWTWLVFNKGKLEIINTINQDSPISLNRTPILALDLWEHAYYLKYKNKRVEWIKAFWNVVNWEEVNRNYLSHST